MIHAKFGAYRMNRFEVIQILVYFVFSSAAIMDFENGGFRCMEGVKTKLQAKFGENRTNGSGVNQVFLNFKMAAGAHLVFQISRFPVMSLLRAR